MNKPTTTQIGLRDLRTNLTKYTQAVQKGNEFIVYNHRKPVFKVSPITPDEWGDEGNWETLIDFREISPNGVPIEDVLESLKRLKWTRQISL